VAVTQQLYLHIILSGNFIEALINAEEVGSLSTIIGCFHEVPTNQIG